MLIVELYTFSESTIITTISSLRILHSFSSVGIIAYCRNSYIRFPLGILAFSFLSGNYCIHIPLLNFFCGNWLHSYSLLELLHPLSSVGIIAFFFCGCYCIIFSLWVILHPLSSVGIIAFFFLWGLLHPLSSVGNIA